MNIISRNLGFKDSSYITPFTAYIVGGGEDQKHALTYLLSACGKLTVKFADTLSDLPEGTNTVFGGADKAFVVLCTPAEEVDMQAVSRTAQSVYLIATRTYRVNGNIHSIAVDEGEGFAEAVKTAVFTFMDLRNASTFQNDRRIKLAVLDTNYESQYFLSQLAGGIDSFFPESKQSYTGKLKSFGVAGEELRRAINGTASFLQAVYHTGQISKGGGGLFKSWLEQRYGNCPLSLSSTDALCKFPPFASLKTTYDLNAEDIRQAVSAIADNFYKAEVKPCCFESEDSFSSALEEFKKDIAESAASANAAYTALLNMPCASEQEFKKLLLQLKDCLMSAFEREEAFAVYYTLKALADSDNSEIDYKRLKNFAKDVRTLAQTVRTGSSYQLPPLNVKSLWYNIEGAGNSYTSRSFAVDVLQILRAIEGQPEELEGNRCFKLIADRYKADYPKLMTGFTPISAHKGTGFNYYRYAPDADRNTPSLVHSFEYSNRILAITNEV